MQFHRVSNFALSRGALLREAVSAYRTLGTLNAEGTNAVLVLHGYTTGPSMLDAGASVAEGSWSELVGPGKAVDSERLFVVAPNMLGSCYGSTGPASIDPATGLAYGENFPRITLTDIVALQKRLLDSLGVKRLAAAIGPSFGGYQAWQWAVQYPDFVERIVAAVSAPFHPPGAGHVEAMREQMKPGLVALRVATLTRYGVDAELAPRFPDAAARQAEIQRMAEDWARGFDADSLLTLMHAAQGFDVRPRFKEIQARVLIANSRTDIVFPPEIADQIAPALTAAGVRWQAFAINSDKGHFASGADAALWADALRAFMESPVLKKLLKSLLALLALLLFAAVVMVAKAEWDWQRREPMAQPPLVKAPTGEGPVLILLHGAGLNGRMWDAVRRDLDPRWRVIALDLPGHGARLGEAYTLEAATAAVKQAAAAVVPAPVLLIGDSLGGYTAMAAASALPPQQLRGLILGGASGNFEPSEILNYFGNVVMVKTLLAFMDEQQFLAQAMSRFGFAPADAKTVLEAGGSIRIVPVAVRALMGEDFRSRLTAIQQPVLFVNGSDDERAIAKEKAFVAGLPRAPQIRHFANTGHGVSIREPKQFAALVNEFAAQVIAP